MRLLTACDASVCGAVGCPPQQLNSAPFLPMSFPSVPAHPTTDDVFRLNQALVYGKKFELVICDEAHRLKVGKRGGLLCLCRLSALLIERAVTTWLLPAVLLEAFWPLPQPLSPACASMTGWPSPAMLLLLQNGQSKINQVGSGRTQRGWRAHA